MKLRRGFGPSTRRSAIKHIKLTDVEQILLIDTIGSEIADMESEAEDNESVDFKREAAEYISQLITLRVKVEEA
jgi:hypothetical protein